MKSQTAFFSIIGRTGISMEFPSVITSGTEDNAIIFFIPFFSLNIFTHSLSCHPLYIALTGMKVCTKKHESVQIKKQTHTGVRF